MTKQKIINLAKRYLVLVVGLFIMALGVSLSVKADLGTSPVSCVPYVISLFVPLTMGQVTIIMHVLFILLQILLLRRQFQKYQLLQLVVAFVFGYFTDFALWLTAGISVHHYYSQWLLCGVSWIIIAFGVFMEVRAGVILLAGEGVMLAISKVFHVEFGKVKVGFDCTQVVIGTLISLTVFHRLQGIREGTIAAAIFVGMIVRVYKKKITFIDNFLENGQEETAEKKEKEAENQTGGHVVVTIAREYGSGGREIGKLLAKRLGIEYFDKELIDLAVKESGFSKGYVKEHEEKATNSLLYDLYVQNFNYVFGEEPKEQALYEAQSSVIKALAKEKSCVIVGRLANFILAGEADCCHVFIHADKKFRMQHMKERDQIPEGELEKQLKKVDNERKNHCRVCTKRTWGMAGDYDLTLDAGKLGCEKSVELIASVASSLSQK